MPQAAERKDIGKDMSKAQNEYVLEMKGVVKEFPGVRALDGVNLKVRPGKVHVICGENGAGKSTLMKIINGTYVADEGEMIYKGEHVGARSVKDSLNMGIAMIYQELNPVLEMTLAENIWLGREPKNGPFVDFGKMYKDTQDLLDRLELRIIKLSDSGKDIDRLEYLINERRKKIEQKMLKMDSHAIERLQKQRKKFLDTLREKDISAYEMLVKYRESHQ